MTVEHLDHLFRPIDVGHLTLENRVVFASHTPGFSLDPNEAVPGRRYGAYLARRAEGGAGLVVLGHRYCFVRAVTAVGGGLEFVAGSNPFLWSVDSPGSAQEDAYRSHIATIVAAVHARGVPVLAQFSTDPPRTAIGELLTRVDYLQLAPSPGASGIGLAARALELEEIQRLVAAAGRLARVAKEAGLDGVELHCHAGDLASDFLSPVFNRRTDHYGGTLENRMRFIVDVLRAVRANAGDDFVVGLRFSLFDQFGSGYGIDEGIEILRRLEQLKLVDEINIYGTFSGIEPYSADGATDVHVEMTAQARAGLSGNTPVLVAGSISDPASAERILSEGKADLIGMVRALIADPDAPRKAREGRSGDIRRCVFSAEGCLGLQGAWRAPEILCTVNPEAGSEEQHAVVPPAKVHKRVVIVGGGPAGLKTAEQAATRGHSVVLFEADPQLGGRVWMQAKVPSRATEGVAVSHLIDRIEALGVEVHTGIAVDAQRILAEQPDTVVLATGTQPVSVGYTNLAPQLSGLPGADLPFVLTDEDVLRDAPVGQRVVIVDDSAGDFAVGLTAEYLLDRGHDVQACTRRHSIGHNMFSYSQASMMGRLTEKGLRVRDRFQVTAIVDGAVTGVAVWTQEPLRIEADSVVLSLGRVSDRRLRAELLGAGPELFETGDAIMPRSVGAAILDGFLLGRHI
jgi:2,4-dienoyl-CoA reductase-like NADH-dependent reductase (Old Yellow Enzyme family)/thioredoxin reductase